MRRGGTAAESGPKIDGMVGEVGKEQSRYKCRLQFEQKHREHERKEKYNKKKNCVEKSRCGEM